MLSKSVAMVWDQQKLLQVNRRKNVLFMWPDDITHQILHLVFICYLYLYVICFSSCVHISLSLMKIGFIS